MDDAFVIGIQSPPPPVGVHPPRFDHFRLHTVFPSFCSASAAVSDERPTLGVKLLFSGRHDVLGFEAEALLKLGHA